MDGFTKEQMEAIEKLATTIAATQIKELGLDKVDQKNFIVPQEVAKDNKTEREQLNASQKERFGNMTKALFLGNKNLAMSIETEIKAADPNNITNDADGGMLVPPVTEQEIMSLVNIYGKMRPLVSVSTFPLNAASVKTPKAGNDLSVSYPGENGAIAATKLNLNFVTMYSKKATGMAVMTDEVRDFAIPSFYAYILDKAGRGFAKDEDTQICGISNSPFNGLFYGSNAYGDATVKSPDSLVYEDINHMLYSIPSEWLAGASFTAHRTVIEAISNIKDQMGRPIFNDATAGQIATLKGYPINIIEAAPINNATLASGTPYLLFGNLKNAKLKDRQSMRVDLLKEATIAGTSLAENDLTAIRFIRHWSFDPASPETFSVIKQA